MPTYDYRCKACSHKWEEWQSITAAPTKKCPECGKPKAERVIGPGAGLLFRGSGFYITDYRSDSYKKAAKAESGSNGNGKSESKSEGKKSEAKASKD
ncbi:MAG TPA: zinc ribbon domain-containing protein [Planctomycetaceae bacterium]